jgi:hypothetical protein
MSIVYALLCFRGGISAYAAFIGAFTYPTRRSFDRYLAFPGFIHVFRPHAGEIMWLATSDLVLTHPYKP